MKPFNTGLEDGNDPRKKLLLGIVALACVLAFGLCLDLVSQRVLPSGEQATSSVVDTQGQDGQAEDEGAATETDTQDNAPSISGCSLSDPRRAALDEALSKKADELEQAGSSRAFTCLSERESSTGTSVVALLDGTEWIFSCEEDDAGSWEVEAWKASTLVGLSDQLTALQEQVREDEEARAREEAERQQQEALEQQQEQEALEQQEASQGEQEDPQNSDDGGNGR